MMMNSRKPSFWREAASLILTVPRAGRIPDDGPTQSHSRGRDSNIDVLMLKRGKKSSFMANVYVFPGGVTSDADFDARGWTHIFQRITGNSMATTAGDFHIHGPRPPMMVKDDECGRYLAPEIAFRICAIRETFEESGILLVTNKSYVDASPRPRRPGSSSNVGSSLPEVCAMPSTFSAALWRQKVSKDAENFQRLCDEYDVVPNVWALTEWCNWLTPVFQKVVNPPPKPKRFDTIFFLCCLDGIPQNDTQLHTEEISSVEWDSPLSWYGRGHDKEITLVGPQYYEISRLASFHGTRDILNYARTREPLGVHRWMSVSYICQDGIFFTLPGDELYPDQPDYEGVRDISVLDESVLSNCHRSKHFHRGIRGSWDYYCNVPLPYGLLVQTYAKRTFPQQLNLSNSRL